jgi:uncharacterized protein YxeA
MKKLLTILIALTIFLLISCNIFAASETSSTETPLISNESDSLKCNVYIIYPKQFYKLFCPIYVNGLLETS